MTGRLPPRCDGSAVTGWRRDRAVDRLCHHETVGLRDFFERLIATTDLASGARTTGPPPSGNGASSFHLTWEAPPVPLRSVEVTIEVTESPSVESLYFWALQVNFERGGGRVGGAHFGLQYHPAYPGGGAVNWGGYADAGGELTGSVSELPSALDNINTRTFPWQPHRPYRYRVAPSPGQDGDGPIGRWQGSITDLETGAETVVRDLWIEADHLTGPMVWSEVFADCDAPTSAVRWSEPTVTTVDGRRFEIDAVRLNYQTDGDGGCANTDTSVDRSGPRPGFLQRTSTDRRHPTGSRLTLS